MADPTRDDLCKQLMLTVDDPAKWVIYRYSSALGDKGQRPRLHLNITGDNPDLSKDRNHVAGKYLPLINKTGQQTIARENGLYQIELDPAGAIALLDEFIEGESGADGDLKGRRTKLLQAKAHLLMALPRLERAEFDTLRDKHCFNYHANETKAALADALKSRWLGVQKVLPGVSKNVQQGNFDVFKTQLSNEGEYTKAVSGFEQLEKVYAAYTSVFMNDVGVEQAYTSTQAVLSNTIFSMITHLKGLLALPPARPGEPDLMPATEENFKWFYFRFGITSLFTKYCGLRGILDPSSLDPLKKDEPIPLITETKTAIAAFETTVKLAELGRYIDGKRRALDSELQEEASGSTKLASDNLVFCRDKDTFRAHLEARLDRLLGTRVSASSMTRNKDGILEKQRELAGDKDPGTGYSLELSPVEKKKDSRFIPLQEELRQLAVDTQNLDSFLNNYWTKLQAEKSNLAGNPTLRTNVTTEWRGIVDIIDTEKNESERGMGPRSEAPPLFLCSTGTLKNINTEIQRLEGLRGSKTVVASASSASTSMFASAPAPASVSTSVLPPFSTRHQSSDQKPPFSFRPYLLWGTVATVSAVFLGSVSGLAVTAVTSFGLSMTGGWAGVAFAGILGASAAAAVPTAALWVISAVVPAVALALLAVTVVGIVAAVNYAHLPSPSSSVGGAGDRQPLIPAADPVGVPVGGASTQSAQATSSAPTSDLAASLASTFATTATTTTNSTSTSSTLSSSASPSIGGGALV